MRGSFGLLKNTNGVVGSTVIGGVAKRVSCSAFSTSSGPGGGSGDGRGRGRGRGRGSFSPTKYDFVAGSSHPREMGPNEALNDSDQSLPAMGRGHGRGKPLPSSPFLPSFNTFVESGIPSQQQPGLGRGRGGVASKEFESGNEGESRRKGPLFVRKDEVTGSSSVAESVESAPHKPIGEKKLPQSILTVLTGSGRGKPEMKPVYDERPKEENRHLRPRRGNDSGAGRGKDKLESKEISSERKKPKLSREEAVRKAVGILSKKDGDREGGRDRGRGRGRGRRQKRDDDEDDDDDEDEDEEDDKTLFMGDDADGEKLAQKLGPAVMAELTEAFEDLSTEVLPDPVEDEYIEALDTNLQIELEPEYLMGEFETNPDIHENPPIPLRDALEKMKPFLMAYEGIESQEEWEEVMKETMERVPLLKDIVDHYCGPDRVTAKQQHGELDRVAKTLPASAPNAVTRFTDRAVLSLQSNPGWGFDRKCQFMDKLVNEFSKSYK